MHACCSQHMHVCNELCYRTAVHHACLADLTGRWPGAQLTRRLSTHKDSTLCVLLLLCPLRCSTATWCTTTALFHVRPIGLCTCGWCRRTRDLSSTGPLAVITSPPT